MITNGTVHEAVFRVATPMFLSGADSHTDAELRLASLKGALRFWWRASAWSRLGDVARVREEEARLFDSTPAGHARIVLKLSGTSAHCARPGEFIALQGQDARPGEGLQYLGHTLWTKKVRGRGYGPDSASSTEGGVLQFGQSCLQAPFEFSIKLLVHHDDLTSDQIRELHEALKLLGLLGGLGSRSRRGFGATALHSLRVDGNLVWQAPNNLDALFEELGTLWVRDSDPAAPWAPYTAFTPASRILVLSGRPGEDGLTLLDRLGKEMLRFRSWGKKGRVLGERAERNFRDDHRLMRQVTQGKKVATAPARTAFGLPQPYYFSTLKSGAGVSPDGSQRDRRASPLFFHVREFEDQPPAAVVAFLPATFLPPGDLVQVGQRSRVTVETNDELWQPIHDFLDRLLDSNQGAESFEPCLEVRS